MSRRAAGLALLIAGGLLAASCHDAEELALAITGALAQLMQQ